MMSLKEFIEKFKDEYSDDYLEAVYRLLKLEGGFVNDADDRGGKTKYGISMRFIQANYDAIVDLKIAPEVIGLTLKNAVDIYYYLFWEKLRLGEIKNKFVRYYTFDMSVNMGRKTAARILQVAAKRCGANIKVDGVIGGNTLRAVNSVRGIELELIHQRVIRYAGISKKINNIKFIRGWMERCFAYDDLLVCLNK